MKINLLALIIFLFETWVVMATPITYPTKSTASSWLLLDEVITEQNGVFKLRGCFGKNEKSFSENEKDSLKNQLKVRSHRT